jgi:hypothetical protein
VTIPIIRNGVTYIANVSSACMATSVPIDEFGH